MKKLIKDLLPFWIYVGCITMFWLSYLALPNLVIVFFIYYPFLLFGEFAVWVSDWMFPTAKNRNQNDKKTNGNCNIMHFYLSLHISYSSYLLQIFTMREFSVKEFFKTYENFETRIMAVETFVSIWLGEEISKNVYENQEEKQ